MTKEWRELGKLHVLDHPLIQHKITHIRDVNTGTKEFRELVDEVAMLMAFEITRHLPLEETKIETPVKETTSYTLSGKKIGLIPILRAGLGMVDGMLNLLPAARVEIGRASCRERVKSWVWAVALRQVTGMRIYISVHWH